MSPTQTTLRPADLAEASAALADTTGRVLVRIAGAGTAADWAGRPMPADLVLDTTALTGVLAHNPSDMTVEVRAGTPLRELAAVLARHRQRVALDAARIADGATVGGLMATADSGPLALAHGSLRDVVIGATVVLADGTPARSGGHVIKNVAGYDLTKLAHGCHGTLALIAHVVLRLHPLPSATATVALPCALDAAAGITAAVLASPLEPTALEWCGGTLLVRLEGSATAMDARAGRLETALGDDARRLDGADADAAWREHAALVDSAGEGPGGDGPTGPGAALLRIGVRPSRLAPLLARLAGELGAGRVTAGLATGIATLTLPAHPDTITRAHSAVHAVGGTSMLRARPAGCDAPAWGPPPSSVGLMRTIRAELDPAGRLGAGRFTPWLPEAPP